MKSLSLSKPHVLMMVGTPGSGKTFFADKFAETFHAPYLSYQKIKEFCPEGDCESLAMYQFEELLKTNQSIIVEGGTETRTDRSELAKKARAAGYDVLTIWVQADEATAKSRALKSWDEDTYDNVLKRFTPPTATEKPIVISGHHTYASQAKVVLQRLTAPRAEVSSHSQPPTRVEPPSRRNITIR